METTRRRSAKRCLFALAWMPILAIAGTVSAGEVRPVESPAPTGAFIAISTPDSARLARWWVTMFDVAVLSEGSAPDRSVGFALLRGEGLLVEIVERSRAAAGPPGDRSFQHGPFKVGFIVPDLERAERELRERGANFVHGIVRPAGNPLRTFAVRDPDGNVVQLFGA